MPLFWWKPHTPKPFPFVPELIPRMPALRVPGAPAVIRPRTPKAFWVVAEFSTRSCGPPLVLPLSELSALTVFAWPRLKTPPTPDPAKAVAVVSASAAAAAPSSG
jgi:hypothetical protein